MSNRKETPPNSCSTEYPVLNAMEQEVVVLDQMWGLIDDIVSWAIFVKPDQLHDVDLLFHTNDTRKDFYVRLCDLLSPISSRDPKELPFGLPLIDKTDSGLSRTILHYLSQICKKPELIEDASLLSGQVDDLLLWLNGNFETDKIHFPSLSLSTTLCLPRYEYILLFGNILKHNVLRLSSCRKLLKNVLKSNKHEYDNHEINLAMFDLMDGLFEYSCPWPYHSNQIAERLNNLRWEIYCQACSVYSKSYRVVGEFEGHERHGYDIPQQVSDPTAQLMFRSLMLRVRRCPRCKVFKISKIFGEGY